MTSSQMLDSTFAALMRSRTKSTAFWFVSISQTYSGYANWVRRFLQLE
jgi:vacuolar-type H+-ATPase catalytic subunit A/Vma1